MSLLRYFAGDPWAEFTRFPTLFDQDFGLGLRWNDLNQPSYGLQRYGYLRPWRHVVGQHSGTSEIQVDKDNFKVIIDVQQFAPNEITVKTDDKYLVVEGKHEEKEDEHGFISRHFVRRYLIPEGVKLDAVTSSLSSDGVLSITAPKAEPVEDVNVRSIPITMTGAPAVKQTDEAKATPPSKDEEKK